MAGTRRKRIRRGITGIEAAIVLIAFVIVAASLAFVTLNMGMFTTQKSKEAIQRGLGEATSALEVDGSVTALTDGSAVNYISIPIKLAPGRTPIDMNKGKTAIHFSTRKGAYEDINLGVCVLEYNSSAKKWELELPDGTTKTFDSYPSVEDLVSGIWTSSPSTPEAYVIFIHIINKDTVIEYGEKALVLIGLDSNNALNPYEGFKVEMRPPEGAPLTVERTIPAMLPEPEAANAMTVVDLG